MLRNYLLTAFRHLWRHRVFSLLNIAGLTIGLSACFLAFLYVRFELSYDGFHAKADRIYRMVTDIKTPNGNLPVDITSPPMAINIGQEFPEVEKIVRFWPQSILFRKGDIKFQESHMAFADSTFFSLFDLPLIEGNAATALRNPWDVVLTETAAKRYFGKQDPMGQHLILTDGNNIGTVTAVMKDMPENTLLKADALVALTTFKAGDSTYDKDWGNFGVYSYLLLRPGANAGALEKKFPAFLESRIGSEMQKNQQHYRLSLEPLKDVYLHSHRSLQEEGNIHNVYIFSIIGGFILLIAAINFVNLTTARATERAKEVGIRKVIGAGRRQLTGQFLGESLVLVFLAFVLSALVSALLIPAFNRLAGKTVSTGLFEHPGQLLVLLVIAAGVGLLAGVYPALVLSAFQPIKVLKGRFAAGSRGLLLRRMLVVIQFTISIGIIVATIIIHRQLDYMRNQDLGLNDKQMLMLDTHGDIHRGALKNELLKLPGVNSVSMSSNELGGSHNAAFLQVQNHRGEMQVAMVEFYVVDLDYMPQYQMKMIAGRMFSKEYGTDTTSAIVVNERALQLFGYRSPQEAIGKKFIQWGGEGTIIGVVKDFHFSGLQREIQPFFLRAIPSNADQVSVNVRTARLPETIAAIQKTWSRVIPYRPFDYFFADEYFDRQYKIEEHFGKLFLNFAVLAILISCMGLLGLASYATIQRTKEIGIRKVLGASVAGIVRLLSREFLVLVVIAFLIATPVCWYLMHGWLHDFYYRIAMPWWVFGLGGIMALLIAMLTIAFQAIRAAVANPINSLRHE